MKRLTFRLTAFLPLMMGFNLLNAQSTAPINIVTTAVPFLRISPDARAGGMGDLGVATSADASSALYNNAKTPFAKHDIGIGLTYTPWLKDLGLNDVYLLAASGFYKLNDKQALSASIRYFSLGNIQFTDNTGQPLNTGQPREFGADFGYSQKLSDKLSIGLALRYIHSNLAAGAPGTTTTYKPGNAVAGDVSLFYSLAKENGQGWNFGLTVTNLGSKIGYTNDATQKDFIPANLSLGAAYTAAFDEQNKITFGLDLHKLLVPAAPTDTSNNYAALTEYRTKSVVSSWFSSFSGPSQFSLINLSVGAEYSYDNQFFLRVGYYYESASQGDRKYFTVGVGVKYEVIGLNFSYLAPSGNGVTRNPLSNTLRFGLVFDLDNSKE
jgi:type IX secretion system protein PorV